MEKLRAILVDDEESARDVLENLLILFFEDVEVISKCGSVPEAVDEIKRLQPDLVFLDIEMPKYAGYELVKFIEKIDFEIIFVTAYDQYAIKAFEVAALDYLLKPIDLDRLQKAIDRVKQRKHNLERSLQLELLKENIETKEIKSLMVFDKAQQHIVSFESIIAIEAQESYCIIYTTNKNHFVSKNLGHFEKTLEGNNQFFRVHRSWIINRQHLLTYSKSDLTIHLTNNISTRLSKYRKLEFEQILLK